MGFFVDPMHMTRHVPTPNDAATEMEEESIRAWLGIFSVTARHIREAVAQVVKEGAEALAEEFYDRMQKNPRTTDFLDQERVQQRLRASLRRWMTELFTTLDDEQLLPAIRRQIEVGVVHARIRLPIDLIPAGIRVLKRGIRRRIDFTSLDAADRLVAQIYVSDLLHLADSLMNQAYFRDMEVVVRNDEAYRLVAQKRSASFERARQRAALSEWAESLLMAVWSQQHNGPLTRLRDSEFGVWMHHKGAVMFDGSHDFRTIVEAIETMDNMLLPHLQPMSQERDRIDTTIGAIKNLLDLIRYKVNDLFESSAEKDEGLDRETQLHDRRYLPAILSREMRAHMESTRPCCLMLIDITFPSLKGASAEGTRNRMRQVAASIIGDCLRTTDHLFRFDENRFLLVAVECASAKASQMAAALTERLRQTLHTGNVQGSWTPVSPSVHIGIAEYDRHPDYQYFIQRVETALAEAVHAKRARNSVA